MSVRAILEEKFSFGIEERIESQTNKIPFPFKGVDSNSKKFLAF